MARPIKLIRKKELLEITELHQDGVPLSFLIRKFKLNVAPPTLAKLVNYMTRYISCEQENKYIVAQLIHDSLFPKAFEFNEVVVTQPNDYAYIGKMPVGYWLKRESLVEDLEESK
jgi:hypothetical protein